MSRPSIPVLLTLLRLAIGLILPLLALLGAAPPILAILFALGFLSDIFDGVIARRLGISTLALRRLDSRCDLIFTIGSAAAVFLPHNDLFLAWLPWIYGYLALFLLRNLVDYLRYKASPSYHMWSGKIWALTCSLYLFLALLGHPLPILIPIAFALYAWNAIEGTPASLILPTPATDIPSLWQVLAPKTNSSPRH